MGMNANRERGWDIGEDRKRTTRAGERGDAEDNLLSDESLRLLVSLPRLEHQHLIIRQRFGHGSRNYYNYHYWKSGLK